MTWAIKWKGGLQAQKRGLRPVPPHMAGYDKMCFRTKREARQAVRQIARTGRLWNPSIVRVVVKVEEAA